MFAQYIYFVWLNNEKKSSGTVKTLAILQLWTVKRSSSKSHEHDSEDNINFENKFDRREGAKKQRKSILHLPRHAQHNTQTSILSVFFPVETTRRCVFILFKTSVDNFYGK